MADNNEIRDDEVISVELGQEGEVKTVEEEIADVTPTEAPVEDEPTEAPSEEPSEGPTEEPDEEKEETVEEKSEDSSDSDTTSSENPSVENGDEETEKTDEEPTEPPTEEPNINEELEAAKLELEKMKEAEATRQLIENINVAAVNVENEVARFENGLINALKDTFKQYDIDLNTTLDELKEKDPAKFAIAQELIQHAENIRAQKMQEIHAPLVQAQKNYVFREASKVMCEYELTDEQAQEAAQTFVNIMNTVGIMDIGDDLKSKVELAVARAKMVKPVKEEVKEEKEVTDDKETVKETTEEHTEEPSEAPTEPPTETPTEEPKVDIEAFKEDATTGDAIVNNREGVTVDNVLKTLSSLPFKERTEFYKKYADMIREAGIQNYKKQGLR